MNLFGQYIKRERLTAGFSLRKFCEQSGVDASNWSKVERGLADAPTDEPLMKKIGHLLGLNWIFLQDLARISKGELPEYSEEELLKKLPVLFPTRPKKNVLDQIIRLIKENEFGTISGSG